MASASSSQPNTTLYINNLNDKINKEEMRSQLFALFTTHGRVIDVVASKGPKMRGQAFLVFTDLAGATTAMRACEGMIFYDKPLRITYAKSKSYATSRREDPNFVPPTSVHARSNLLQIGKSTISSADKRQRDEEDVDGERKSKRERSEEESEDDEEMEIDEDEEQQNRVPATMPQITEQPSAHLLCTNLPQEVTDDVLSVLFQQYQGFQSTHVSPSPTSNAAGMKVKMAQVLFESPELATTAKEALDGFALKKGWKMTVAYI
ncbi:hypothetical protein SERLA73DRAFT_177630 [Serpula lacrymans var. lacrymans S7.3]|uniref:RRM domain-containing protein n=2 Tax=Serpula lacrymans var. lacrymans TaxID=341189 RepID=F8PP83_SERL3|nr:uncharacterized protein SERLADRAFT_461313 [Serpula lacrymans var. lacrymans S7.9]EGO01960.1 hypothetical protein SERLA73DRAFT_177630 [Serpula lacrymans var. lacrymans S7.3]EGO27587.1 hypothetical protein SERLADRAFT_461313 [Serpula lacrymans var. lacrymans S7.9]